MRREYERIRCPGCHRQIAAYLPQGDGSGLRLMPHKYGWARRQKTPCPWSDRIVVWGSAAARAQPEPKE